MKLILNVLIAAVTVSCLAGTIDGRAAVDAIAVPYIEMLLPPLEDGHGNDSKDAATTKINAPTKAAAVYAATKTSATTASTTTTARTTTTKKPISHNENKSLPELSLEALLPPLLEAKLDKENAKTTTKAAAAAPATTKSSTTTTTTRRPTTTRRTTTTPTTAKTTITSLKPSYATTTTLKPAILKVPDLSLDPFLPPLLGNEITADKVIKAATRATAAAATTQKPPTTAYKSHYQQQQQIKHTQASSVGNIAKNYNKPVESDRHDAATQTQAKQVTLTSQPHNVKLPSQVETVTQQYVAKQKPTGSQYSNGNSNNKNTNKQNNYTFDVYLGSTTPRPAKNGLPTITPFPKRLGR